MLIFGRMVQVPRVASPMPVVVDRDPRVGILTQRRKVAKPDQRISTQCHIHGRNKVKAKGACPFLAKGNPEILVSPMVRYQKVLCCPVTCSNTKFRLLQVFPRLDPFLDICSPQCGLAFRRCGGLNTQQLIR